MNFIKIMTLTVSFCLLFTACASAQTGAKRKVVTSKKQSSEVETSSQEVSSQQSSINSITSNNSNNSNQSFVSTLSVPQSGTDNSSYGNSSVNQISSILSSTNPYQNDSSYVYSAPDVSINNSLQTSSLNLNVDYNAVPDYLKDHPVMEGTRDKYYWPFTKDSIWNMPIGSNAKLEPAGLKKENNVAFDAEYFVQTKEEDPVIDVYYPSSWTDRLPGSRIVGELKVPNDFYVADGSGHNNCGAFIMPNGYSYYQLCGICRTEEYPDRITGGMYGDQPMSLYGKGTGGSHFGSGLSAIGGSIRKGELTSDGNINHAIKINVWANKYLYYSSAVPGYVWPADRCDGYANTEGHKNKYGGTNPLIAQGSLLVLPKNVTVESLELKTEVAKKIFYALQNYGAYISDDSAWSCYALCVENGVDEEVQEKYGYSLRQNAGGDFYSDFMKMVQQLCVVTNNSADSIGGGGTPCQPLAPDFAE